LNGAARQPYLDGVAGRRNGVECEEQWAVSDPTERDCTVARRNFEAEDPSPVRHAPNLAPVYDDFDAVNRTPLFIDDSPH
jgi:hypothetical protein